MDIPRHLATKAGEDVDYVAMPKASRQRASILLYLGKAGYDIKIIDSDGFTRAMSLVKWSIPNPSSSIIVDLFYGPAADLLHQAVKYLRSLYTIEPILSFLKHTFYVGGLESSVAKSDLIDHDHDHEEGTVGILDTGVPRLACLQPMTWLHQRPGMTHRQLKTLARGQASRRGQCQDPREAESSMQGIPHEAQLT